MLLKNKITKSRVNCILIDFVCYLFKSKVCVTVIFPFSELKQTVRKLEEWLKEAEIILKEPLRFNQKWTQEAIDIKKSEIQVSQN